MLKVAIFTIVLSLATVARSDEFNGKRTLSADERAQIEAEQDAAHKVVDENHQGDTSHEAEVAKAKEYQEADDQVLAKHGLDREQYLIQGIREGPKGERDVEAKKDQKESKQPDEEAKQKAKQEIAKPKERSTVEVVKGFNDDHPMNVDTENEPTLDKDGNPLPPIEKGFTDEEMSKKAAPPENGDETPPGKVIEVPAEGTEKAGEVGEHRVPTPQE